MPRPARHGEISYQIAISDSGWPTARREGRAEQGFLDDRGAFMDRMEAAAIAIESGEIGDVGHPHAGLFTEDLW